MSYIGAEPTTAAFPFDQFSGTGAATSFTLTYAPASATSILVAISGVTQNPNLYSVIGTTLTFSPAPPAGTNNISVLYLGLPVIGSSSPGNTAFLSATDLTATAGQTVFASAGSYTPGFVQVYRNGARLGNADFTATNGTTITLAVGAAAGDLVTIEYYTLTSLVNALPLTGGTVTGSTTFNSAVTINGAAVSGFTGMKNRIINGNMVVDQRNAGALVAGATGNIYAVDRTSILVAGAGTGRISGQRSSTAPTGFVNSLISTVTTADASPAAAYGYANLQRIEGYNTADLGWGTAGAATITISFWVRSSITGTYAVSLLNESNDRTYVTTYSVAQANTFEYKTITITGDVSGTWDKTNLTGIALFFGLGGGSSRTTSTLNTWMAPTVAGIAITTASGCVNWIGTNGATFYITGVQLERGSNATSFEFIDYGRQLIQCQRYYWKISENDGNTFMWTGAVNSANTATMVFPFSMRATPTVSFDGALYINDTGVNVLTSSATANASISGGGVSVLFSSATATLTSGRAARLYGTGSTTPSFVGLSSEL